MIEKSILLEKAMKLYNLIASDNVNESQRASEMLERFLIKNNITLEEVIDNELVFFEFEKENKYEVYLFNHLLVCTIQDSSDLVRKCGIRMLSENKMGYKLTKYVKESLFFKYQRLLKVYIESRELLQQEIEIKNKENDEVEEITINFMGNLFRGPIVTSGFPKELIKFSEEHFFISFIRKYKLIPKRHDENQPTNAKQLSQEEIATIMKMEKMYSKQNVENFELDGGNKIGTEFC